MGKQGVNHSRTMPQGPLSGPSRLLVGSLSKPPAGRGWQNLFPFGLFTGLAWRVSRRWQNIPLVAKGLRIPGKIKVRKGLRIAKTALSLHSANERKRAVH